MKKFRQIFILLLAIPAMVFSQKLSADFELSTSTPFAVIDAGSKEYISLDNGYVIQAKMGRGAINIQKFDVNAMKEVSRKSYKDLPKKAFFQDIIKLGDKVYYIFEAFDKPSKAFKVYSREINTADGTLKPHKVLLTTSRKAVAPFFKGELTRAKTGFAALQGGNKFTVSTSFDKSKVLISYRLSPKSRNDSQNYDEIGMFVFDSDMNKVWGKEVTMPYTEKEMNNTGFAVGSDGAVKMLITNNSAKTYEILNITTSGTVETKAIGVSAEKLVRNMDIKEDKSGKFICGGFYANGIELTFNPFAGFQSIFNANGLLYLEIAKDGSLIKEKKFEFSKEFIQQNLNERQKKAVEKRESDGKAGILDLYLTNFEIKDDGSVVFIGERQYIRKEFWNGPQQKQVYHFSNAVAIKVNNGELSWMVKLPKNQAGIAGAGQMGIAYMPGKTADYVAFIDNPKNIALSPTGGIPTAHKDGLGGWLTTYKINNASGALEKHTLFDLKNIKGKNGFQFKPWRIIKAQEGVFLVEVYIKGKKDMMVKMKLK